MDGDMMFAAVAGTVCVLGLLAGCVLAYLGRV